MPEFNLKDLSEDQYSDRRLGRYVVGACAFLIGAVMVLSSGEEYANLARGAGFGTENLNNVFLSLFTPLAIGIIFAWYFQNTRLGPTGIDVNSAGVVLRFPTGRIKKLKWTGEGDSIRLFEVISAPPGGFTSEENKVFMMTSRTGSRTIRLTRAAYDLVLESALKAGISVEETAPSIWNIAGMPANTKIKTLSEKRGIGAKLY